MKIYTIIVTAIAILSTTKYIAYKINYIALFGYCEDKNIPPTKEELNSYIESFISYFIGRIVKRKL